MSESDLDDEGDNLSESEEEGNARLWSQAIMGGTESADGEEGHVKQPDQAYEGDRVSEWDQIDDKDTASAEEGQDLRQ